MTTEQIRAIAEKPTQKFSESLVSDSEKYEAHLNSGHVWKEDEFGEIDTFAFDHGYHNGPECIVCWYSACYHCNPIPPKSNCREIALKSVTNEPI